MEKVKKGVRLENISKIYQDPKTGKDFYAVKDTSLTIEPGSVVTLLGPSGCGKTTTLRMIAGFEEADSGHITIDGQDVTKLPEHKRAAFLGRVFQDPMMGTAPNMQIEENLALAYRLSLIHI